MSLQAKKHNHGFLDIVNDAKVAGQEINIEQYQQMREAGEDHLLVDVREDSEWAAGHAAGAVIWVKALSSAISRPRFRTTTRSWFCTAAAVSVRSGRRQSAKDGL